jgi:outer membrane protein TolC
MKLVNIHKLSILILLQLLLWNTSRAQQETLPQRTLPQWTLQQCLDTAKVHNKNLQMANNSQLISAQMQKEAKGNLLPKLTLNSDYRYFTDLPTQLLPLSTFSDTAPVGVFKEAQFGVPHNISANLQLAIPLYNSQIYGGIEKTKIASEITELQYEKTIEQVYFEIANLYYNAQIIQAQLAFLDSNLVNATKLHQNLHLLYEQLLAKGIDVEKVELQVAQLRNQKSTVNSRFRQVKSALRFAIGLPFNEPFEIETAIVSGIEKDFNAMLSVDYKLAQTQGKMLNSELKTINRSRFLPNINLIGSYGTSGFGYNSAPNSFLNFFPISFTGVQLTYPIFNGGVTVRKANQKRLEIDNSELKISLVAEQIAMQIANTKLQRSTNYDAIETSYQQIKLAQNIYASTILQQKQGLASVTDVLLADNALREAQQSNLSAIIEYLKADLELKKLTGNI